MVVGLWQGHWEVFPPWPTSQPFTNSRQANAQTHTTTTQPHAAQEKTVHQCCWLVGSSQRRDPDWPSQNSRGYGMMMRLLLAIRTGAAVEDTGGGVAHHHRLSGGL